MEGGWRLNAFEFDDFEPNIDDSEDFNLGSPENSKQFGPPLSEKALTRLSVIAYPKRHKRQRNGQSVYFVRGVMLAVSRMPQKIWQL